MGGHARYCLPFRYCTCDYTFGPLNGEVSVDVAFVVACGPSPLQEAAELKRRTSPESAARLLAQHGLEEEALMVLLEGSGAPQPPQDGSGGSKGSAATAPATPAEAPPPGSTPMLATTWDLLRSLLRQVLQRDAAAAGRARAMLEGWRACPDPQRQVGLLPTHTGT